MTPLANEMRPTAIDDIIGQQHILGKDMLLRRLIESDMLSSIILYGPPGTGKTSIANVIAHTTSSNFQQINATTAGKKDMQTVVEFAQKELADKNKKTILFIDEIHRFNKSQQDYLLPFVENGTIILIGATTENPYFEVNGALLSRSQIFELYSLSVEEIKLALTRIIEKLNTSDQSVSRIIDDDAVNFLADASNGDARTAINALDLALRTTTPNTNSEIHIDINTISNCIQKKILQYDKDGDNHYDTISAFIKSMRGSDPDATLYYLARMIQAGEDPKYIARRIMIHASEDVGMADPTAINVATSAALAVERVGLPEGQIILAQAALHVALAPKSNSVVNGIGKAMEYVSTHPISNIPIHLKDAHYKSASKLGRGINYQYPHDYPKHWINQRYLPDDVNETFYQSDNMGYQIGIDNYRNWMKS